MSTVIDFAAAREKRTEDVCPFLHPADPGFLTFSANQNRAAERAGLEWPFWEDLFAKYASENGYRIPDYLQIGERG